MYFYKNVLPLPLGSPTWVSTAPLRAPRSEGRATPAPPGEKAPADKCRPSFPAIPVPGWVLVKNHNRRGYAKGHPVPGTKKPRRGPYEELEGGHAPGVFHPDSRCTPAARALACPARIVKICWRPFSSGFPPSLASPLGPALGGGYVGRTSRWPAPDLGVIRREGCSLPEGLRARPMFPSHLGSDGAGFEKPGVGGEVPRASSAAPHGLLTRGLPPSAWAVNTRAIVKQSLTRAGAC